MDNQPSKLRFQEKTQAAEQQEARQAQTKLTFGSVEELLRHDAAQVTPPPTLPERLKTSLAVEKAPKRRWWQHLFSRHSSER